MHPTFRSINKHLTLLGCDRRLILSGMFIGGGIGASVGSVVVGMVTFACFAALGRFKTKDPIALRLLFNPGAHLTRYDPANLRPFHVVFYDHS